MIIEIIKKEEEYRLENLLQLYLHDLSLNFPLEFDSNTCKYNYESLDKYFNEKGNYAYFIRKDDSIIGFALINSKDNVYILQELFILNNYKNQGYGENTVKIILNKHKGQWKIKVVPNSKKAFNFWKKTIERNIKDFSISYEGKYKRAVFAFNNK